MKTSTLILRIHDPIQVGRVDPNAPLVAGHKGPVLDIAWSPFNDNVIASASDDTMVRVWNIPNMGLIRTMTDPVVELAGHQRKVQSIHWHPSALNVLLSVGRSLAIRKKSRIASDQSFGIHRIPSHSLSLSSSEIHPISVIEFRSHGLSFKTSPEQSCNASRYRLMSHSAVTLSQQPRLTRSPF